MIEVSGGITLNNVKRAAMKGVDFISIGSLTHSARAMDITMEVEDV
jgi:nicotinate-nucleotide pyrophosphorylase (carboxylating)